MSESRCEYGCRYEESGLEEVKELRYAVMAVVRIRGPRAALETIILVCNGPKLFSCRKETVRHANFMLEVE